MANPDRSSVVEAYRDVRGPGDHPHLDPINPSTFLADRALAVDKAVSLLRYQKYLASARTAKAKRKGATLAFERNVLAQARQAQADLGQFTVASLSMTQQVNHTTFWNDSLARMTESLRQTGPVTAQAAWTEIASNEEYASALAAQGLTAEVKAAITEAVSKVDVTLAIRDNKICIESLVAGEDVPRRAWLKTATDPPKSVMDLLRRSQFDRVVSAFTNNDPVYMEVVGGGSPEYQPSDLMACGAVAAAQRMAEHVRKLEDTGLATYEGEDPLTVAAILLISGALLAALGLGIAYLCMHPTDEVEQPEWVCTAGEIMEFIGMMLLFGGVAVLAVMAGGAGGALIAFASSMAVALVVIILVEESVEG